MPPREFVLDLQMGETFEWGAMLASVLAYWTSPRDSAQMESCFYSTCAFVLHKRAENNEGWAANLQPMKFLYASRSTDKIASDIRKLERRLRHLMIAGKMGIALLKYQETGELPQGMTHPSIAQVAEWVTDEAGMTESKNVRTRIWQRYKSLLHFAIGIALLNSDLEREGKPPLTISDLITHRETIEAVVRKANECIPFLAKNQYANVDVKSLVRIRLAE